MAEDTRGETEDDLKAKFREALEKKQSHDPGVEDKGPKKVKAHETNGPQGGVQMHRRKAGGGGA